MFPGPLDLPRVWTPPGAWSVWSVGVFPRSSRRGGRSLGGVGVDREQSLCSGSGAVWVPASSRLSGRESKTHRATEGVSRLVFSPHPNPSFFGSVQVTAVPWSEDFDDLGGRDVHLNRGKVVCV